jgi:UDP-N-acetyl-D-mannosaminuronate dehydrogenase
MLAERLAALGADLRACDPYITGEAATRLPVPITDFGPSALADCDLVILLVDHPEFDAATICEHAPLVFDTKGRLRGLEFHGEVL